MAQKIVFSDSFSFDITQTFVRHALAGYMNALFKTGDIIDNMSLHLSVCTKKHVFLLFVCVFNCA